MASIAPDPLSVVVQIVLFVCVWAALGFLWFRPALRVVHERAARSEGALREAQAIQAEAEKLRATHATALDEARSEAQREMQEILRTAEAEQKRLIAEAREDAHRTLGEVHGRVTEELVAARQGLRTDAESIAREVVRKVLGRPT